MQIFNTNSTLLLQIKNETFCSKTYISTSTSCTEYTQRSNTNTTCCNASHFAKLHQFYYFFSENVDARKKRSTMMPNKFWLAFYNPVNHLFNQTLTIKSFNFNCSSLIF